MADNTTIDVQTGGDVIATDDIGGVKHQRVKIEHGNDGEATDVSSSSPLPIYFGDSPSIDAFSRVRVSNPYTVFDSKLINNDKSPLQWDEQTESGSGVTGTTPTQAKPYIDFQSTLNTAAVYTRRTFRRFNYQPGKSQMTLMTGVLKLSGGGTGVIRRIGLFDDNNGIIFQDNEGTVQAVVRSNDSGTPVDTIVDQSSWNLDVMDGTGRSGVTLDWTKAQIFVIDFQWLSFGRIRWGIDIGGILHYVHQHSNANVSAIPWSSTPNLPLCYQMVTTGSSPASSMRVVCSAILSEGGRDKVGLTHSHGTTDHVNANTADEIYALAGVRLKSTHLDAQFDIRNISMLSETNDDFEWMLIHDPTVAGTFTYGDKDSSCMQVATGATANTVTGGVIITRGFGAHQASTAIALKSTLGLGSAIDGTRQTLVLAVRPLGTNADIQGSISWLE